MRPSRREPRRRSKRHAPAAMTTDRARDGLEPRGPAIAPIAMTVDRSVGGSRSASRQPTMASERKLAPYSPMTTAAVPARRSRSTSTLADARAAAVGPYAASARPARPPGMSRPQLSRSIARTATPSTAAASTAHGAQPPTSDRTMPATNSAPRPSSAIASAVAFHAETNVPKAVADSTTGTRRRKPDGGTRGIGNQRS